MATSLTSQLAAQKRRYEEAKQRGDTATMEAAHREANRLRSLGASEAAANRQVYGRESGYYSGWKPTTTTTSSRRTSSTTSSQSTSSSTPRKDDVLADAYQRALQHVQYFGSPEEYARQIVSKGASNLTDLEAAKAFISSRPDLFTQETALNVLTYGKPTYADTGQISGPTHIISGSNWGVGGNTLFLPSKEQAGSRLSIVNTPVGTVGVWVNPATGQVSTSAPQELKQATGIPELPPYWREQLQQQMPYQQQQMQPIQQLQAQIAPYIDELQRIAQGVNIETAPVVMNAYNQVMGMIDRLEKDLISRFEQQGQGVDPATQAALASLKETVKRQRENLLEDLSRRGLLQSGIWLEMEDRLNRGELTEQQRILSTRLSDLQNQLNQALASIGTMRVRAAQQFGTEQIRQAEAAAQRRQQAIQTLAEALQRTQEQMAKQQQWLQEQAWEREKFYAPWTLGPTPAQLLPYQYPTANELVPYEMGPTPYQQQSLELQRELGLKDYLYGPTPYQQQQLAQALARQAQQAQRSSQPSATDVRNYVYGEYMSRLKNSLDNAWATGGWAAAVELLPVLEAEIYGAAPEMRKAGIDPQNLIDYIYQAVGGFTKDNGKWVLSRQDTGRL